LKTKKFINCSPEIKVARGEPHIHHEDDRVWERVTKDSQIKHSEYYSTITNLGTQERGAFNSNEPGILGSRAGWALINVKFVDPQIDQIVTSFRIRVSSSGKIWGSLFSGYDMRRIGTSGLSFYIEGEQEREYEISFE
jgi:hypothetical protein